MPASQLLQFEATISPTINYALQQNHVPIIHRLVIHNSGDQDFSEITLQITAEPAFAGSLARKLALLPAQASLDAGWIDLQPKADFLAGLTERLSGALVLELLDQSGVSLLRETVSLDILAFDEWSGLAAMPEMLCAFIMPEHPALAPLLQQAAQRLQLRNGSEQNGSPSLDGYQSQDASRVRMQAAAIYDTLQAQQIVYSQSPASLETAGQKVRLADAVLDQQAGTGLDLTLLLASSLEAAGLNVLVILTEGHAFAGVWLQDQCFPESVQDDASVLEKRIVAGSQELLLVESTALATGSSISFEEAERLAAQRLRNRDTFICAIDVRRSRASGIRPLQLAHQAGFSPAQPELAPIQPAPETVPEPAGQPPLTRQKQWERKLLDLSLRNTLLNFRTTRNTIRLLARQLDHFEDLLAGGEDFQILERPLNWPAESNDLKSFENQFNLDPYREFLDDEFSRHRLRTSLSADELATGLTGLYRSARSSLEENGANTLYLALGFLKWYETAASQQPRYAPLVLAPVDLVRRSARQGYVLRVRDEEPQANITLLEMLRQDFAIIIGGLDPLPRDASGSDLQAVFGAFRQAVLTQPRWEILEAAYLGIFSFTRFIMWHDIRNRAADLVKNQVVASLLAGKLTWQPAELLEEDCDLDDLYSPENTFLPVSADASQLVAVHAAGEGHSFVLHGPPGTGKSQTITNIIGNALARGQTVLFVAEKMAALSVVQRRLEKIGLSPFCLELHSSKSRKTDVLDQLRRTLEISRTAPPGEFARQADRLHQQRLELKAYVRQLYHEYPFGLSLFDAIARYGELTDARDGIVLDADVFSDLDRAAVSDWFSQINELAVAARDCGVVFRHPLADFRPSAWSQSLKTETAGLLRRLDAALPAAETRYRQLDDLLNLAQHLPADRLSGVEETAAFGQRLLGEADLLSQISSLVSELPLLPPAILRQSDLAVTAARLKSLFIQGRQMSGSRQELLQIFREPVLDLDGRSLLDEWQKSRLQWLIPRIAAESRLMKVLKPYVRDGVKLAKDQIASLLQALLEYREAWQEVKEQYPAWQEVLCDFWRDLDTDWSAGLKYAESLPQLNQHLLTLTGQPAAVGSICRLLADCLADPAGRAALLDYAAAFAEMTGNMQALTETAGIRFDQLQDAEVLQQGDSLQDDSQPSTGSCTWFGYLAPRVKTWQDNLDRLREWCVWRTVRAKAEQTGLTPAIEALEQGLLTAAELPGAFEKAFHQAAATWIINREPALCGFSGQIFEEKIRQFQKGFEHFEQLTQQEIYARLSARMPAVSSEAAQSPELGILQRAIRSNGRGMSIRRLFEQIPGLLVRLAPCMLMSPISVAQYLDPRQALFDLVVFDEASQMPTSEAAGALARGRHAVIVGDPRQLPPTSFFTINSVDEDNLETEDLESVLDDCLALSMPQTHLLWHYRSR
ncbi:MAG TPA: DNA helicase, partial [Clostridiales bacterium]|nr:DNA helicase [Clostridiales bacterium]